MEDRTQADFTPPNLATTACREDRSCYIAPPSLPYGRPVAAPDGPLA